MDVHIFSKNDLIKQLIEIRRQGWIKGRRKGNAGSVGNTLEDLLGIEENNLPIPNAAEWELKTRRENSSALTTLFHTEPSPRALKFVPKIFLPKYGWAHQEAGKKYPANELSFRQTISGASRSDRGFKVIIDRDCKKVLISFDHTAVSEKHSLWLKAVESNTGLGELNPQPYWGFDDLFHKAGTKLLNCFFIQAEVKKENNEEYFYYKKILMLQKFNFDNFLIAIENNHIFVDFDARTGHNHGTKFRLRENTLPSFYTVITEI